MCRLDRKKRVCMEVNNFPVEEDYEHLKKRFFLKGFATYGNSRLQE